MTAGLLTAGAGHPWETELVAALDSPGAPLTVIRRCADIADVLATASTGQVSACVLAADLRRLDSEAVQRLAAADVVVVVVHPGGDLRAPARLDRIGVTATVADDAGAPGIIDAIQQALAASATATVGPARPATRSAADPRWALVPRPGVPDDEQDGAAESAATPSGDPGDPDGAGDGS
ncbi:MAG TPA: chromosome partitioning protein, partial [Nakamurella sp.]|nr:chromosome partitioning protein [Nakamurella sp.]